MDRNPPPAPKARTLPVGVMHIYDFDGIRLHAYQTKDPMKDESFLIETDNGLIGLETPAFSRNLLEYENYFSSLKKPLDHLILANHGNGGKLFKDSRVYTTASVCSAFQKGGRNRDQIDNFARVFGPDYNGDTPEITDIIQGGKITIGGVDFIVIETREGFDLEIVPLNSIYTHMAGSDSHNILTSVEQIDDMLQRMNNFRLKNYRLMLTSHELPEPISAADKKIEYLEITKNIVKSSGTREDFIAAMRESFPDYTGENYLRRSAEALFH
jgi:hypothetical protein